MKNHEFRRHGIAVLASAALVTSLVRVDAAVAAPAGKPSGRPAAEARCEKSPLATTEVRQVERTAQRLVATPAVRAAGKAVEQEWREKFTAQVGPLSAQSEARLKTSVRELLFTYAQRAANNDPARPKVSWSESPPHEWFGDKVPGGRYAGDNPDTVYRIIPLDGESSYVIRGRVGDERPAHSIFEVTDDGDRVVATDKIELKDLVVRRDGTFTITVDPRPANGRTNHLRTGPKTTQLFIRDTLSDWSTQTPSSLSVERVAGPGSKPRTFDQLVAETVRTAKASGTLWIDFFILRASFGTPPNVVPQPPRSAATISRSTGNYWLGDDEALVVTTRPGPSSYTGMTVQDVWTVTPDYWKHQTSLTDDQAIPNPDGTYTLVVSHRDPGVHNWVDTTGLREGTFLLRWQGASLLTGGDEPYVSSEVVKLSALPSALPTGTEYVTPGERKKQLKDRRAGFERRITTCGR